MVSTQKCAENPIIRPAAMSIPKVTIITNDLRTGSKKNSPHPTTNLILRPSITRFYKRS
jgi:hypothetical protein